MFSPRGERGEKGYPTKLGEERGNRALPLTETGCPSPIPPLARRAPFLSPLSRGEDVQGFSNERENFIHAVEDFAHRAVAADRDQPVDVLGGTRQSCGVAGRGGLQNLEHPTIQRRQ